VIWLIYIEYNIYKHCDWPQNPPEEWARWLWRYPREVAMHPGILRAHYGINLSSVRGMLMVMVRALHGVIAPPNMECLPHSHCSIDINTRIIPVW